MFDFETRALDIKLNMGLQISVIAGECIGDVFGKNTIIDRCGTAIFRIMQNWMALNTLWALPAGKKLFHFPQIRVAAIATAAIIPLTNAYIDRAGIIKNLDRLISFGAKVVNIGGICKDIEDFRGHLAQDIVEYIKGKGYLSDIQRIDIARRPSMYNTFKEIILRGSYRGMMDKEIKKTEALNLLLPPDSLPALFLMKTAFFRGPTG